MEKEKDKFKLINAQDATKKTEKELYKKQIELIEEVDAKLLISEEDVKIPVNEAVCKK